MFKKWSGGVYVKFINVASFFHEIDQLPAQEHPFLQQNLYLQKKAIARCLHSVVWPRYLPLVMIHLLYAEVERLHMLAI